MRDGRVGGGAWSAARGAAGGLTVATAWVALPTAALAYEPTDSVEHMFHDRVVQSPFVDNDVFMDTGYVRSDGDASNFVWDMVWSAGIAGRRANGGDRHLNAFVVGFLHDSVLDGPSYDAAIGLAYYDDERGSAYVAPVVHTGAGDGPGLLLEGNLVPIWLRAFAEVVPTDFRRSTGLVALHREWPDQPVRRVDVGVGYNGFRRLPDWRAAATFGPERLRVFAEGDPRAPLRTGRAELRLVKRKADGVSAGPVAGGSYFVNDGASEAALGGSLALGVVLGGGDADDGTTGGMHIDAGYRVNWVDDLRRVAGATEAFSAFLSITFGLSAVPDGG